MVTYCSNVYTASALAARSFAVYMCLCYCVRCARTPVSACVCVCGRSDGAVGILSLGRDILEEDRGRKRAKKGGKYKRRDN